MGMKIFFCEGCGKKLTDNDLAKGTAKDKQKAGLYCTSCAAGVATDRYSDKIIKAVSRARFEKSEAQVFDNPVAESVAVETLPPQRGSSHAWVMLLVGLSVIVAGLIFFLLTDEQKPPAEQTIKVDHGVEKPPPTKTTSPAAEAYSKLEREWNALPADDLLERISAGEEFLKDFANAEQAPAVKKKVEQWKTDAKKGVGIKPLAQGQWTDLLDLERFKEFYFGVGLRSKTELARGELVLHPAADGIIYFSAPERKYVLEGEAFLDPAGDGSLSIRSSRCELLFDRSCAGRWLKFRFVLRGAECVGEVEGEKSIVPKKSRTTQPLYIAIHKGGQKRIRNLRIMADLP